MKIEIEFTEEELMYAMKKASELHTRDYHTVNFEKFKEVLKDIMEEHLNDTEKLQDFANEVISNHDTEVVV